MSEPSSRRTVLRATAGLAAGALVAGCVGQGASADGQTEQTADGDDANGVDDNDADGVDDNDAAGVDDNDTDGTDGDDTETDAQGHQHTDGGRTETRSETASGTGHGLVSQSFETVDVSCGEGTNTARVVFSRGSNRLRVRVEGVIRGPDGCTGAVLERAGTAPDDASTFRIEVGVESQNSGGVCTECVVDAEYRATFEFEGNLPETVAVFHETAAYNPVTRKRR